MDIRFITGSQVKSATAADVPALLASDDGFVWIDLDAHDEHAERVLTEVLHAHPLVVAACLRRNHVPTVHAYTDHVFVVLHSPIVGSAGHVHLLELDQLGQGRLGDGRAS
jgi:Mg2+ and Co2+ transporter CorA